MKIKAFFSRRVPLYLMGADEMGDSEGFDAYPVEVEDTVLANVRSMRRLIKSLEESFEVSAPEESAQAEADLLSEHVGFIFKQKAQRRGGYGTE